MPLEWPVSCPAIVRYLSRIGWLPSTYRKGQYAAFLEVWWSFPPPNGTWWAKYTVFEPMPGTVKVLQKALNETDYGHSLVISHAAMSKRDRHCALPERRVWRGGGSLSTRATSPRRRMIRRAPAPKFPCTLWMIILPNTWKKSRDDWHVTSWRGRIRLRGFAGSGRWPWNGYVIYCSKCTLQVIGWVIRSARPSTFFYTILIAIGPVKGDCGVSQIAWTKNSKSCMNTSHGLTWPAYIRERQSSSILWKTSFEKR